MSNSTMMHTYGMFGVWSQQKNNLKPNVLYTLKLVTLTTNRVTYIYNLPKGCIH